MTTESPLSKDVFALSEHNNCSGALVYWSLSSGTNGPALIDALEGQGLRAADGPKLPAPARCLTRAAKAIAQEQRGSIHRHNGVLWCVDSEALEVDGAPVYRASWGVKLGEIGMPEWYPGHRGEASDATRENLRDRYMSLLDGELSTGDVSSWLLDTTERMFGLMLRRTGGIYFIPHSTLDDFTKRVQALHSVSACKVYMIPAMHASMGVAALVDALAAEVAELADRTFAELDSGDLGARAIETRTRRAEALLGKVEHFEKLLDTSLDELTERAKKLAAASTAAHIAAMSKADAGISPT